MKANSEVLLYCSDEVCTELIKEAVIKRNLRIRSSADLQTFESWLAIRTFGLVMLSDSLPIRQLRDLVTRIWLTNDKARIVVLGLKGSTSVEALLLGTEILLGPDFKVELDQLLDGYVDFVTTATAPAHILVVEDLDSPRDIICLFLEGLGYSQVTGVASAQQALELLNNQPGRYTAIITDVRMPHMSGAELIKEIRRNGDLSRIPVIALTAYGTGDCLFECLQAGATGFLVKPPKKADLQRELGRAERVRTSGASVRLIQPERVKELEKVLLDKGLL